MVYGLLLLNILFLVAGQIVWKMGLAQQDGLQLHNLLSVLFSPLILLGIAFYGIATVLWLFVLSRLPLSIAYPLQSLAYVFGLLAALYLFGEVIPVNRWLGAGIIILGVMVITLK
ncbi:EamA family transporter [Paenibacillus aquistagni]|uniref:EamA family transporter n=1 Tax=Paenibacillus aquistagni TaxID=1852522 RepID=UPI00145AFE45|nr:EamA family transporter [Paenibacillus aquistagni]NMM54611.1 EamA family transporter [Paenibacillus aquistagni]